MIKRITAILLILLLCFHIRFPLYAERVVGENGGVSTFPEDMDTSSPIKVSVRENVSRYAVDLIFPDLTVAFAGASWNVNELTYEIWNDDSSPRVFNIVVENHSNESIVAWGEVDSDADANITIATTDTGNYKLKIPGVNIGATEPQRDIIAVSIAPSEGDTWQDILESLFQARSDSQSYTIGTVSVFIEKP